MSSILKLKSQLIFITLLFVASTARKAFLPNGIRMKNRAKSISEAIFEIRGGGDRGYSYDDDYGRDDDRGYEYGDGNVGSSRYDYEDDRYANDRDSGDRYAADDDDYYGSDRRRGQDKNSSRRTSKSMQSSMPDVGGLLRNGNKKIGMMLLGGGAVFTLLGISLFFNKTLMRLGNLLFIFGVPLFIGPGRTTGYFLQPEKARATGCLGFGIFLVFIGWPIFGIALEVFGIMNLFGNMFPFFMVFLKQMPIVGNILKGGSDGASKFSRKKSAPSRNSYRYDEDEDDRYGNDYEDRGRQQNDGHSDRYY